jgi:lipopolysaccharide export system protein LptA
MKVRLLCLMLVCLFSAETAFGAEKGKARAKPTPPKKVETAAPKAATKESKSEFEKTFGGEQKGDKAPLFIRSATVTLDAKNRVFVYRDDVEITRADMVITADVVTGRYNAASEIETVICEQNVVITKGDRMKATSNKAVYNVKSGTVVLTAGPELNDRGNVLAADKVTIFVNEDRSEAEGNVRVKVTQTGADGGVPLGMGGR